MRKSFALTLMFALLAPGVGRTSEPENGSFIVTAAGSGSNELGFSCFIITRDGSGNDECTITTDFGISREGTGTVELSEGSRFFITEDGTGIDEFVIDPGADGTQLSWLERLLRWIGSFPPG